MKEDGMPLVEGRLRSVLLFGPPGSGKGKQGEFLGYVSRHVHLSLGAVLRGLSPKSPIGTLYRRYAVAGNLLPDEVVVDLAYRFAMGLVATNRYAPEEQLLLLDGVPRTRRQAELLDRYVDVRGILYLHVPDRGVLVERLSKRSSIEGRADDRDVRVVEKRIELYEERTAPLLAHYPEDLLLRFDASRHPLEVLRDILVGACDLLQGGRYG